MTRFTQGFITKSGLLYLRTRYYDPVLGRFISPDPFLGRLAEPSTQNRYVYVKNNPLGYTDPSGVAAVMDYHQIGAAILRLGPKIDSPIEYRLVDHYFYGDGQPFYMTSDETVRYRQNPLTSEFNYAIGSANPDPATDRIDVYDFNRGNRPLGAEIATRLGGLVGALFGGKEFEVYPSDAMCRR